jgi:hypothetical protein
MSAAEVAQVARAIGEHAWLTPLIPVVWFMLRTRMARAGAQVIRVATWDWPLRLKGVPDDDRRKLIADAAQRDLESP